MEKIRLLVTASTFPSSNKDTCSRFVLDLSKRLQTSGKFECIILAPHSKGSTTNETMEGIKIRRYRYMYPYSLEKISGEGIVLKLTKNKFYYFLIPFFLLFQLLAIRKIVKKNRIDIIHAHWAIPQGFIAILYKKVFNKKIKIFATIHGTDIFGLNHKIGIWMKKFVLQNIDKLTVVSNAIKDEVLKIGYHKEVYVYSMGVDTIFFHPSKKEHQIKEKYNIKGDLLLFVGRFAANKGAKYLLKSLPAVLNEFPLIKLILVGSGILEDELVRLAKELNIENNVFFVGPIVHTKLPSYFASADLFIGPSIVTKDGASEGFGLVFAEAMSCGSVVVATDLPAIADIIKDNETGFIVKQKNAQELSEKIIYLLKNKENLKRIRLEARKHIVQNYDWEIVANKYTKLINSI